MKIFFVILATYIVSDLLGYWIHRLIHQPFTGFANQAHMNHHLIKYPTWDFQSTEYRGTGKDSLVFYFAPFFIAISIIVYFVLPLHLFLVSLVTMSIVAFLNNYMHDRYHLKTGKWSRLHSLHFTHHEDMDTNYGIYGFFWDRIFGTFKK